MSSASEKSILVDTSALLRLAIPSTIFTVLTHAYRSVDQFWIQDVSVEAQAAIGATVFVLIVFAGLFEIVGAGVSPWVARATGAGDDDDRRKALGAGLFGAIIMFLVVAITGSLGADAIVAWVGLDGQTAIEASKYLTTISLSSLPLALTPVVDLSFTAMGKARLPMKLHALSLLINLILTPVLIYEAGLGIIGAALASNLSRGVAISIGLVALIKETKLPINSIRGGEALKKIIRIGGPVGLGTIVYALVYWVMLKTSISPLGPHVNAALGIGFSALEGFTWPCFHGVSLAVASFVGRALGAKEPQKAKKAMQLGLPLVGALGLMASLLFYFGGSFLTGLFASDAKVHLAATQYTVILAYSQMFVAGESLYEGVLNGAGATKTVFWVNLPINASRIILAWYFAFPLGHGAAGVWWAINLTTVAKMIFKGWFSHQGKWMELKL